MKVCSDWQILCERKDGLSGFTRRSVRLKTYLEAAVDSSSFPFSALFSVVVPSAFKALAVGFQDFFKNSKRT
jgi:hypothetical protein